MPARFGQSVIAGNPAGKDGRRSQDVCPDSLFLACLDPDPARAGEKYEALREALVKFLDWRGALFPEELVDETFNRVARKLEEGETIRDAPTCCHGVARLKAVINFFRFTAFST